MMVTNFTPEPRRAYTVGLPRAGVWREILNTDAEVYGGSGHGQSRRGNCERCVIAWATGVSAIDSAAARHALFSGCGALTTMRGATDK